MENGTDNGSVFNNASIGYAILRNNSSDDTQQETSIYISIYSILYKFILPGILFLGFAGNFASIFAFMGKELRNISSSVYVQAVLLADTGMLISLFFVWLEVLNYRLNHLPIVCQFLVFWQYICSFLSVWYMVCITTENYITICHPTKIQTMCTVPRATKVTISLAVISLTLYIVSVFATSPILNPLDGKEYCSARPQYKLVHTILTYGDSCITVLIPVVIIILMLTAILLSIARSLKNKRRRSSNRKNKKGSSIPQVRVAKMLLCLSLTFVVMNVPSHVIKLYFLFVDSALLSHQDALIHLVFLFVSYLNFIVKFFLFTACSANFRNALFGTCSRKNSYQGIGFKGKESSGVHTSV